MPDPSRLNIQRHDWRDMQSEVADVRHHAEKRKMDVTDLMRQCNGKIAPSKALLKFLAKELDISESTLDKLADEVRKDLSDGSKIELSPGRKEST